jgi:hypothetical protein
MPKTSSPRVSLYRRLFDRAGISVAGAHYCLTRVATPE